MSTLKIAGVDDDMGSDLVLDGEDGEIGASYKSSAKASHSSLRETMRHATFLASQWT